VSKPFMLPRRNPKRYYRLMLNSYNTPDFASRSIQIDARSMGNRIEASQRIETKVVNN
jgi:hypothetical protein